MARSLTVGVIVWSTLAGVAQADELHFFGPEGTGTERRVLVVVVGPDQGCVPLDGATAEAIEDDVEVSLLEEAGPCARWMEIVTTAPRNQVSIRIRHLGAAATGVVAMGSERGLSVEAAIRRGRLVVRVGGAPDGEPVRVLAIHSGGQTVLEPGTGRDVFVGPRPPDGPVGVVARTASLTGAAALAVGRLTGPAAVIVPSAFEIPAGGAPRVAAFLVVTDAAGRLSRNVPLRVMSDHAALRSLEWIGPGLAAVSLSARGDGLSVVELSVRDQQRELATAELPVGSGAPVRARLDLPGEIRAGDPFEVRASVLTSEDASVPTTRLRVVCPGGVSVPVGDDSVARCPGDREGPSRVTVQVALDGRLVPLGTVPIQILGTQLPMEAPAVEDADPEPLIESEEASVPRSLELGVFLRGALDSWGNGGAGFGARVAWAVSSLLGLGLDLRYQARGLGAPPSAQVVVELKGVRHELAIGAQLTLAPMFEKVRWVNRLTAQAAVVRDRYELGGERSRSVGFVPGVGLATGIGFGGRAAFEIMAGTTVRLAHPSSSWREPPVTFFLELGGRLAR